MVFFRFEDGSKTAESSPVVNIKKEALDSVPDSLLAVLTAKRWKTDKEEGSEASNPIDVEIPCEEEWTPDFAEWIKAIYKIHLASCDEDPHPTLITGIPNNVELTDAWTVLDYFGLAPDDPTAIDLSSSKKIIQIRAALFIRHMRDMNSAKDFILDDLISDPHREKMYVFANSSYDIDYILQNNYRGHIPVRQLGSTSDMDKHFEWIPNRKMRQSFVSSLEDEGLNACFLHRLEFSTLLSDAVVDYTYEGSHHYVQCYQCGEYGHYQYECPASDSRYRIKYATMSKDKCWAMTKEGISETLYVLKIAVPNE